MREFTLSYSRVNFVNTYRVRITHDSLKLKMLEALKQKQQDQLTIIWAQVVPIKDHIDLAQFAKRVKEPAVVLIPWISQDHPFCRVLPSDTSIKNLLKNNFKVNCAKVNHCPELTGKIIIIINEHASVFNLNTVEGKSVKFAFRRCFTSNRFLHYLSSLHDLQMQLIRTAQQAMQRTKHNPKVRLHEAPPKKILWHFPLWSIRASRYLEHFYFMEDVKQATVKLSFWFFWTWIWFLG